MADIELAIKIPNEMYQKVLDGTYCGTLYEELKHGVLIPKGHGRLIDADELKKEYPHDTDWDYPVNTNSCVVESIDNSHTIIEADKESENA